MTVDWSPRSAYQAGPTKGFQSEAIPGLGGPLALLSEAERKPGDRFGKIRSRSPRLMIEYSSSSLSFPLPPPPPAPSKEKKNVFPFLWSWVNFAKCASSPFYLLPSSLLPSPFISPSIVLCHSFHRPGLSFRWFSRLPRRPIAVAGNISESFCLLAFVSICISTGETGGGRIEEGGKRRDGGEERMREGDMPRKR